MNASPVESTVAALLAPGKGILAADESLPTIGKRFAALAIPSTEENRRAYKEEGTTSTPFDLVVMNDLDRFHLVNDVIDRVPQIGPRAAYVKQALRDKLIEHKRHIAENGEDMPEIRNWKCGTKK